MEFDAKVWLKQYNENYREKSEQAKELKDYIKQKGNANYIPWATMERMLYEQDPTAEFIIVENGTSKVWTDFQVVETRRPLKDKGKVIFNMDAGFTLNEVYRTTWCSHFVKIKVTFLGKTIIEDYPVQEIIKGEGYVASKIIDQNLVNKAIQRGKAKAASRVSGLALKLYESKDLQFEPDELEEPKPAPKKGKKKTTTKEVTEFKVPEKPVKKEPVKEEPKPEKPVKKEPVKETPVKEAPSTDMPVETEFVRYAKFMKENKDKLATIVQAINTQVASTYKFTFNLEEDTVADIAGKLEKVKNGRVLLKSMMIRSGFADTEIKKFFGESK